MRRIRLGIRAYLALFGAISALPIGVLTYALFHWQLQDIEAHALAGQRREAAYLAEAIRWQLVNEARDLLAEGGDRRIVPSGSSASQGEAPLDAGATPIVFSVLDTPYALSLSRLLARTPDPLVLMTVSSGRDHHRLTAGVKVRDLLPAIPAARPGAGSYLIDGSGAPLTIAALAGPGVNTGSADPAGSDAGSSGPPWSAAHWITRPVGSGWMVAVPRRPADLAVAETRLARAFLAVGAALLLSQLALLYSLARHVRHQIAKALHASESAEEESVISEFAALSGELSAARRTAGQTARDLERAMHDALTGLPGRELFLARAAAQIHFARAMEGYGVTVLFIDLDGFKAINDRYGHRVGDEILKLVAARLRECVRPPDSIARLGGDEFVVCLAAPLRRIEDLASSAAARISEAMLDMPHGIGCSIGWASSSPDCELGDLISRADAAMYVAKRRRHPALAQGRMAEVQGRNFGRSRHS